MAKKWLLNCICAILFLSVPLTSGASGAASALSGGERTGRRIERLMPEEGGVAHLTYTYNHFAAFKPTPGQKVGYFAIDFGGLAPIPVTEDFILGVGAGYCLHYFRLRNITNYYNKGGISVHDIALDLHGMFLLGDNWVIDVGFIPTIASDLKGLSVHDIQFNGNIVAGWAFSDSASLLIGVEASKKFWVYLPYPVFGLVVRPEDSFFDCEVILPKYARINFKIASFSRLFARGEFEGFVWDMTGDGAVPGHFMKMFDSRAGAGIEIKIMDGFLFEVWGGANPYRKYEYRDRGGREYEVSQDVGFFIKSTFSITPEIF